MGIKQEVIESLERLPDDATVEDVRNHLYIQLVLKERLKQEEPTLTQEEVEERMKRWLE